MNSVYLDNSAIRTEPVSQQSAWFMEASICMKRSSVRLKIGKINNILKVKAHAFVCTKKDEIGIFRCSHRVSNTCIVNSQSSWFYITKYKSVGRSFNVLGNINLYFMSRQRRAVSASRFYLIFQSYKTKNSLNSLYKY